MSGRDLQSQLPTKASNLLELANRSSKQQLLHSSMFTYDFVDIFPAGSCACFQALLVVDELHQ
jgi:tRNA G26 N,N-dimethylase Trm1